MSARPELAQRKRGATLSDEMGMLTGKGRSKSPLQQLTQTSGANMEQTAKGIWSAVPEAGNV